MIKSSRATKKSRNGESATTLCGSLVISCGEDVQLALGSEGSQLYVHARAMVDVQQRKEHPLLV